MEILSFVGIIAGLLVFIAMCLKKVNMLLTAVVSASVMIAFSGMPFMQSLTDVYIGGVAVFLKIFLLLFALSALFGKVMEDSGAVRSLALALAGLTRKSRNNQKFFTMLVLPVFYMVLGYVGISGFVVVFTVVALGRELFRECDIPWKFYCYGSSVNIANGVLAGNLQAQHIQSCAIFGVSMTSGMAMSLCFVIVNLAVICAFAYLDINKAQRAGEGFFPSGKGILELKLPEPKKLEDLPSAKTAVIPLIVPVLCIAVFKLHVLIALTLSIVSCFALFWNKIENPKQTLGNGITAAIIPVVNVAAAAGLASIIAVVPGFKVISGGLDRLPSLYAGIGLVMSVTLFTANPVPVFTAFAKGVVERFTDAGLSAATGSTLALCSGITPCPPWNAGVINAIALTRLDFKDAAWYYFKVSFFPGLAGLVFVTLLIKFGVFA